MGSNLRGREGEPGEILDDNLTISTKKGAIRLLSSTSWEKKNENRRIS